MRDALVPPGVLAAMDVKNDDVGDVTACRMLSIKDAGDGARGRDKAAHERNHWAFVNSRPGASAEVSHLRIWKGLMEPGDGDGNIAHLKAHLDSARHSFIPGPAGPRRLSVHIYCLTSTLDKKIHVYFGCDYYPRSR